MDMKELSSIMQQNGIVGAGGAGFPTYAKLNENADTIILNCAECEPLLRLHRQLLEKYAQEIVDTFHLIGQAVGAKEVIIGIKKAYTKTIDALNQVITAYPEVRLGLLDEVYPAGDEVVLIYEVTGKDEHDQPVYDKDAPFTTWTTRKLEKRHKVIGLIAGHTYILVEDTAPKGWNLMKPVLFTVSSDGRSIQGLSNQMESIEIQRVSKNDYELDTINRDTTSIEQVKLKGRYVTQIYYELTDANKDLIESWIGAGEEHVIRKPFASVSEGSAYTNHGVLQVFRWNGSCDGSVHQNILV